MGLLGRVLAKLDTAHEAVQRECTTVTAHQADLIAAEKTLIWLHDRHPDPQIRQAGVLLRRALTALERTIAGLHHADRQLRDYSDHVTALLTEPDRNRTP
ncbi:hypothetical protein AB0I60_04910 [Actinosynnema sp. NPDC050436]|uniref:hypothetical protein n=1 Tax=Actinosynnema sp. NPDC050436 TaxID=3155659 RepID=UPI0033F54FDA